MCVSGLYPRNTSTDASDLEIRFALHIKHKPKICVYRVYIPEIHQGNITYSSVIRRYTSNLPLF